MEQKYYLNGAVLPGYARRVFARAVVHNMQANNITAEKAVSIYTAFSPSQKKEILEEVPLVLTRGDY